MSAIRKPLRFDMHGFPEPYGQPAPPDYAPLLPDSFGSFAPELVTTGDAGTELTGEVWLVHGQTVTAYTTITAAETAAAAGDLLIVWNGSYAEILTVSKALTLRGASESSITISSNTVDTKVLTVTAATRIERLAIEHTGAGSGYAHGIDVSGADDISLNHIKVRNTGAVSNSIGIYRYGTNTDVVIEDADIEVSGGTVVNYGVLLAGASSSSLTVTIKGGRIKASGTGAVALLVNQTGLTVKLEGPVIDGGVTLTAGTLTGWYINTTGDVIFVGSSVIKGTGSNCPSLGTTTTTEKWGNIYQGVGKDTFPSGDAAGLATRLVYGMSATTTPSSCTDDFNGGMGTHWTGWAGSPFVTPTVSYINPNSTIKMTLSSFPGRTFLYSGTSLSSTKQARLALFTNLIGTLAAIRMDDGSDNNYIEAGLRYSATSQFDWFYRTRAGGGTPSIVSCVTIDLPIWMITTMWPYGTLYTSWNFQTQLYIDSPGGYVNGAGPFAWTPTRAGITFEVPTGGASWMAAFVDWYDII